MRIIACGAALACALVAFVSPALAQDSSFTEKKTEVGQDIRFKDDPVSALAGDPIGAQLTGFHPPRRFDLMRPRWTFVPEMLKSVVDM
jgi:hypothetical protein